MLVSMELCKHEFIVVGACFIMFMLGLSSVERMTERDIGNGEEIMPEHGDQTICGVFCATLW